MTEPLLPASIAMSTAILASATIAVLIGWRFRPAEMRRVDVATDSRPDPPGRVSPRARHGRRASALLDAAYGDALDLVVVALRAGHPPLAALRLVAGLAHPCIAPAFSAVVSTVERGERVESAMYRLVDLLGTRAATLADAFTVAMRTGTPLEPVIDRLADDAHAHRRRQAQAAARELPIKLTFPLVICTLPAFALITIAPMLVGALSSLRTR
jgi:tight adherence protein C